MNGTDRVWLVFAALNGALAVGTGAYASHGLAGDERAQELFRLAGQYQMWHALALVGLAALSGGTDGFARFALRLGGWLFVVGMLLFSGTLYALGLGIVLPVGRTAPTGGTMLIAGWIALAATALLAGADRRRRYG